MSDADIDALNHSGIYVIICEASGMRYIGQAAHLRTRTNVHRRKLRLNCHPNQHLQAAFNKYGAAAFRFEILELCSGEALAEREQFWIDTVPAAQRFNARPSATTLKGFHHSEETRAKLRAIHLGRKRTPEWCARIGEANKRRILSPETIEKQRAALRRAQALNLGKPLSAEHRRKVGLSKLGKKRPPFSDAWRANLSAAHRKRYGK